MQIFSKTISGVQKVSQNIEILNKIAVAETYKGNTEKDTTYKANKHPQRKQAPGRAH